MMHLVLLTLCLLYRCCLLSSPYPSSHIHRNLQTEYEVYIVYVRYMHIAALKCVALLLCICLLRLM